MHAPFHARDTISTSSGSVGIYRLTKLEDAGFRIENMEAEPRVCSQFPGAHKGSKAVFAGADAHRLGVSRGAARG